MSVLPGSTRISARAPLAVCVNSTCTRLLLPPPALSTL